MKDEIYQFKISLLWSDPPIWRQFQVHHDITFEELHHAIQQVMGWEDDHLYSFTLKGRQHILRPGMGASPDEEDEPVYANEVNLGEKIKRVGQKILYTYDFGDYWEHQIVFEKRVPLLANTLYPCCILGERACPPEDCGGIRRFNRIVANPAEELDDDGWDFSFDPLHFSVAEANDKLRDLFYHESLYDRVKHSMKIRKSEEK
jgi:hypothetical protein